jgi:hypothetical protein
MKISVLGEPGFTSPFGFSVRDELRVPAEVVRDTVHAAIAGKTGLVIGWLHDQFIHVPIEMPVKEHKRVDPDGPAWHAVLATTRQPARFT